MALPAHRVIRVLFDSLVARATSALLVAKVILVLMEVLVSLVARVALVVLHLNMTGVLTPQFQTQVLERSRLTMLT